MAKKINASDLEWVIDVVPAPFLTDQSIGQMLPPDASLEPYTPLPGGRYLIQEDGQRVRLDEATGLPPTPQHTAIKE